MLTIRGGTRVIADLAKIGYDAEWQIIGADEVGAWHRRKRIWICAYPRHDESSRWEESKKRHEYKRGRNARSESASLCSDVSNTNSSGHVHRQIKEQPAETGVDAFRESEPSGTHERYVSNGKPAGYWNVEQRVGRVANGISSRLDRGYWSREPEGIPRVKTGQTKKVDRLRGLGNAVCPQVVYEIMKRIK